MFNLRQLPICARSAPEYVSINAMYETLHHLRSKNIPSFDITFPTRAQIDEGNLCFMLPGKPERTVRDVEARIVWDKQGRDVTAFYSFSRRLTGLLVGVSSTEYAALSMDGFDVLAVSASGLEPSEYKVIFGYKKPWVSNGLDIEQVEPVSFGGRFSTAYIMEDHIDLIVRDGIRNHVDSPGQEAVA